MKNLIYDNKIAFAFDQKQVDFRFLQHGEETGAQREGLKTMLEEVEFLTGPDIIQQGQLQVILVFIIVSSQKPNQTNTSLCQRSHPRVNLPYLQGRIDPFKANPSL